MVVLEGAATCQSTWSENHGEVVDMVQQENAYPGCTSAERTVPVLPKLWNGL